MSLYDDYFTNEDKPFAENFNDALLLSNVFDLTVPIELPRMFNNGEWSTGTGQRKAGVSIIQTEGIDNNKIEIRNNSLIANDDATVLITVYPNFNQYGNLQKVYWEFEDGAGTDLTVDVLTEQRTTLLTNIPNNNVLSSVPYLQQLHKFILRLNFEGGTGIKKLGFIMQNKQQDRYGAEVGISDVNGLEDELDSLQTEVLPTLITPDGSNYLKSNEVYYSKKGNTCMVDGTYELNSRGGIHGYIVGFLPNSFKPVRPVQNVLYWGDGYTVRCSIRIIDGKPALYFETDWNRIIPQETVLYVHIVWLCESESV